MGWKGMNGPRKRSVKTRLLEHQGYTCVYCKKALTYAEATFDHIIPLAEGGSSRIDNLVLCCSDCNEEKADHNLNWWLSQKMGFEKVKNFEPIIKSYCLG